MRGQSHLVQGLGAENRQLRERIAELEQAQKEGDFIEKLTCAALTGYCSQGLPVEESAEKAIQAADAVMERIIKLTRAANAAQAEAEGSVSKLEEGEVFQGEFRKTPEGESSLIVRP